jgi:hypothetical protein
MKKKDIKSISNKLIDIIDTTNEPNVLQNMSNTKRKALDLPTEVVKFYQLKAIEQDKSVKKILEEVLIKAAKDVTNE